MENLASDGFGPVSSIEMHNFTDFPVLFLFCQKVLSLTIKELSHYFTLLFPRHSHNARHIHLYICLPVCLSACLSACLFPFLNSHSVTKKE